MAGKYLHSLADENPDLQKQIGCITGVFQILNRHHIVSTRRVFSHSSKKGDRGSLFLNNVTPQRESSFTGQRHVAVEKHKDSSASRLMKRQNLDLRDVVKDSMYREACGLSHNIVTKKETNNWYHDEPRELSRSKSCQFRHRIKSSVNKYYPRFSYDGRETDCLSIKTDSKTTNPRLSLDSNERFMRTISTVPIKPSNSTSNHSRNPKINTGIDADKDLSQTQPSGVTAKLMGLENFPLSSSLDDYGSVIKMTNSTRSSLKEPISPCCKYPDTKLISRGSIEPSPWMQQDGTHAMTSSTKIHRPVSNDYRESMQAVEARKIFSDHDHQNPQCVSRELDVSMGHESRIVIMKPTKVVKKGCMNNNVGKDLIKTDSSKPRKHSNKQQSESRSSNGAKKLFNFQKTDGHHRKTQMVSEYFEENYVRDSSSSTTDKTTLIMKVNELLTPEYLSPVSVLNDSFYADNSPSQKDNATDKMKKVEKMFQKLKNLNSSHSESHSDYIASIYENTNSNDRYISEILLASGLFLRDLKSFNLHPSGHPINPDLFSVLEHAKFSNLQTEKLRRKLIFDAVNEILLRKVSSASGMIMQNPKRLLRELCLEIEQLQLHKIKDACGIKNADYTDDLKSILWEDVMKKSETWSGFFGESLLIAMEIEQLILTDLVDELVMIQANECC